MNEFMRAPINWSCPVCGTALRVTLEDVRAQRTVHCPRGHAVHLVDQNHGAQRLDRELKDFERQMRRLGVKMKYRRR